MIKQSYSIARVAGLLPFGIVLLLGMQTAQAIQCSAAIPPNPQGHWSYRFIDGRKCWYQGENNLSKSFKWPEQTSALSPSSQTESLPGEELMPPVKETVSASSEKHNQSKPDSDSFDARWRGLEMTRVKN